MSGASLLLALAVLVGSPSAVPREGDDGQPIAAAADLFGPRTAVVLPARRAAIADRDLDGIVNRAEARRYYQARFALIDRNRDGRVSRSEFSRPAAAQLRHARGRGRDVIGTGGNGALAEQVLETAGWRRLELDASIDAQPAALFDLLDIDGNGALSGQEFVDAGAEDFATSDADRDGRVPLQEFYAGKRL